MLVALIETNRLSKHYGAIAALSDCDVTVRVGEVFGLLGPNGSGKTTLIRLLLGFLKPTSGWARINGLDCYRQAVAVHRQLSYLPGDVRLFRSLRGREVLQFFSAIHPACRFERCLKIAERLELDLDRPVSRCSTGMRQKIALAAVLANDVPLFILDEPTSNLDPTVRAEVLQMVAEARHAGRTVLFSSHVLSEIEQACDRAVILRAGRVAHIQTLADLRRQHRIHFRLTGELPPIPQSLQEQVVVTTQDNGGLTVQTAGRLAPVLQWLAALPIDEIRIEPLGLQAVYERYHAGTVG